MPATLWFAIGYIIGGAVALFLMHPIKQFNSGYEAAKKIYGDWKRGFDDGWKGAFTAMQTISAAYLTELCANSVQKSEDEDDAE